MEEKSEFFSHLKGLRKEVFYNCVFILALVIAYLVTYNFTNNIVTAATVFAVAATVFAVAVTVSAVTALAIAAFAAFAVTATVFAVAATLEYRDTYKTTFYKPFILVFSQPIIFGASVLYPPAMIALGVLYALAVIYFLVFDKKLITYFKANPPREKEVKPTIIIDTPYREVKINHHTIPPHPLYKWFYNQFMPSEKP